jgi:signal transduction histidine kinase
LDNTKSLDISLKEISKSNDKKNKLKKVDSIYKTLKSEKLDSITRRRLLDIADIYASLNEEKYVEITKFLISNPVNPVNHKETSYCNALLGNYYYNISEYEKAYLYLNNSENSYEKLNDNESISYVKLSKANILWCKNDFVGAEKLSISSLKIALLKKNYEIIYSSYITIANCLVGMDKKDDALQYYDKALKIINKLEKNQRENYKVQTLNYIALVYQKQNKHQRTISILENELDEKRLKELDIKLYCYQKNTKNYSKFKLGDKSVVNQFLETLKIGDSLQFAPIQVTSKTHLGEYYLAQKDTATANFYLKGAQNQAHKNDIFEDELTILKLLGEANPQQNSYYSNRFIHLNDSLQIEERKTRDKFARIEFETDQIITEKEAVEKQNVLLNSRIWIIIGFSFLLLLILFLWFKNKSQKAKTRELILKQEQQKANEEIYQLMIDQQQKIEEGKNIEKQRISLDLHDSVMGKLTAVRMNLYVALLKNHLADDIDFSKQIDEIQEVEKEIRAIAHNLNSDLFSDNANFISVVQQLFNKIENHSQLQFNLHVSDALNWDLVSNNIKINLYRILQEALQNIEKYADAKNVAIIMTLSETNEIVIIISDDGTGFDNSKKSSGIGIKNMKLRMEELNGSFDIQSEIGKGTKINLTIPM